MDSFSDNVESPTEYLDIKIELHFLTDKGVPSDLLISMLRKVSSAIRRAEERELESVLDNFQDWPDVQSDAMKYRFDSRESNSGFNIVYGGKGSLLLFGVASGLAYWVADKTLGETVKEAWVESDSHAKLKSFLKARVLTKRSEIADQIRGDRYYNRREPTVSVIEDDLTPRIIVKIHPDEDERIPTPSEIAAMRDSSGV